MKSLKILFTLFALTFFYSSNAFSQENVTVSATAASAISAGTPSNINFGTILTSETPSIAPSDAGAGYVQYTGATDGLDLSVSVVYPTELTDSGTGTISLAAPTTTSVAYKMDSTDPSGASALTSPSVTGQTFSGEVTVAGAVSIFVGATIDDATNATPGASHTGNITITVDYL